MTVYGTVSRKSFDCSGATDYPLGSGFLFFDAADLVVLRIDATGAESTLTLTTDYTVSGGDGLTGAVTTVATYSDGQIVIYRDMVIQQTYDALLGDGFNTDTFERMMDRVVMQLQNIQRDIGRSLIFPVSAIDFDPAVPAPVADQYFQIGPDGESIVLSTGTIPASAVSSYANIAALRAAQVSDVVRLSGYSTSGDGGGGFFAFDSSDLSTEVAADTRSGIYIAPSSDLTGASGAWVRHYSGNLFASWFGTVKSAATDNHAAITAALTYAASLTRGATVELGNGAYGLASTLVLNAESVHLKGQGSGYLRLVDDTDPDTAGTLLVWTGAVGGTAVRMTAVDGGDYALKGAGFDGIGIDCQSSAAKGLEILSVTDSKIHTTVYEATGVAVDFDVVTSLVVSAKDNQANDIDIKVFHNKATSGDCVRMTGDATANTSLNKAIKLFLLHYDGDGLDMVNADGNIFDFVRISRHASGSGTGVIWRAGTLPEYARHNHMSYVQAGAGGMTAEGTASGTTPSKDNTISSYSTANGTPLPVIGLEAGLSYETHEGTSLTTLSGARPKKRLARTDATVGQTLGDFGFDAFNDAGEFTTMAYVAGRLADDTDGSEDGQIDIINKRAGVETVVASFRDGMTLGGGAEVMAILKGEGSLDFPSIAAGGSAELSLTVTGAETLDTVTMGVANSFYANGLILDQPRVSADDTVMIKAHNPTAGAIDPAAAYFVVTVFKY